MPARPVMALTTWTDGNLPPFRFERLVRSPGGTFNWLATGPSPFPPLPWHVAQYAKYISLPEVAEVRGAGTVTTFFCATPELQRAIRAEPKSTARNFITASLGGSRQSPGP